MNYNLILGLTISLGATAIFATPASAKDCPCFKFVYLEPCTTYTLSVEEEEELCLLRTQGPGDEDIFILQSSTGEYNPGVTYSGEETKALMKQMSISKQSKPAALRCVTVSGAKDANCDGVDDAAPAKIDRSKRVRPQPRQQRR